MAPEKHPTVLVEIQIASIGPITSSTLREEGLRVDIAANEFTIPGLVAAIVQAFAPTH
jgi:uroporphyrinogen-III synthase